MQLPSVESLKIFCEVARHRSFSQAARAHGITQSAASQAVHHLEKLLDLRLINRSTRPLQLTPPGRVYFEGCQRLVDEYLRLEASIRNTHAELATTVQVAAIYSVGLGDMGQYVERFKQLQPGARVHIEYLHPDQVCERVLGGTADFGLVSYPRKGRLLITLPWREEEMVLACAPGHPLAGHAAVQPAQLAGEKYVGFDKKLVIRREVDRFLRGQRVAVDVVHEFDSIENIKKAVEVNAGVALLPEPTLRREVQAGTLTAVPLAGARLVRPLGIIQHRHHQLSATALRFLDLLRQPEAPDANAPGPSPAGNGRNGTAAHAPKKKSRMAPV